MTTGEELKTVIEESFKKERPGVIALEGPWGCGKSYLLNEVLNEWMVSEDPFRVVVTYNAWEDDSGEKPIVPALFKLAQELDHINVTGGGVGINASACLDVLIDSLGLIPGWGGTIDRIQKIRGNLKGIAGKPKAESAADQSFRRIIGWSELYQRFGDLTDSESAKHYKIILVIDDLDRILPERQLDLLESLYHLSQSARILTLVAFDREQLQSTIKRLFGPKITAEKYTQKIFNNLLWYIPSDGLSFIQEIASHLEKMTRGARFRPEDLVLLLKPLGLTNRSLKKLSFALGQLAARCRSDLTTEQQAALLLQSAYYLDMFPEHLLEWNNTSVPILTKALKAATNHYIGDSGISWILHSVYEAKWVKLDQRLNAFHVLRTCTFDTLDSRVDVQRPETKASTNSSNPKKR